MPDEIILYPYRLIPCDFGHQTDHFLYIKLKKYLEKSGWIILYESETQIENEILFARLKLNNFNFDLYLHIYSDGIGVFTLIDENEKNTYEEYDPKITLENRVVAHKGLMTHTHIASKTLDYHISSIRDLFLKEQSRFTSSKEWENRGLSYVMSFYYISVDPKIIESTDFKKKLTSLLFPPYNEYSLEPYSSIEIDQVYSKKEIKKYYEEIVNKDLEMLPYVYTCASWSNFLIIGNITDKIKVEYWRLERDLQHVWFYAYITDKFIERSFKNISTNTPQKKLEEVDQILTNMIFKLNQYEGIVKSTTSEREFILYHSLKETSRLDVLIENVERKANILRNRYNWLVMEERTRTDKKIQLILFIIAIVSAIGAYDSIKELGDYSTYILVFTILLGLCLFRPFFD